jgi:PEP-CTERM motif
MRALCPKGKDMTSRKLAIFIIPAVGLAMLICGIARANVVLNSDFSSYVNPPKDFFSNVQPTYWSSGNYVFVDAPNTADMTPGIPVYPGFPNPPLGGNFIEADGTPGLSLPLTQTISGLNVGDTYTLSFYQAGGQQDNDTGNTTEQWEVSLGSQTQYSALMSTPSASYTPWQTQSMLFTATSPSEALSFVAIGTGLPPMVFLANPDLEDNVPEPSAFLLLGGIGTVSMFARRRRRRAIQTNPAT